MPSVQRKVKDRAEAELTGRLHVPVSIGQVKVEWFNRITLDSLYLEDESGRALFEAGHVSAGFKLLPLLKGKFVFTSIRLFGFALHLTQNTPKDKLNLQFVIDVFQSKDTAQRPPDTDFQVHSILIRRGYISYDVLSKPAVPGRFDAQHIRLKDISANIALQAFNGDSLDAQIKKMSFSESSGLDVSKLSLHITSNKDSVAVSEFEIKLPHSDLNIAHAHIDLTQAAPQTGEVFNRAPLSVVIAPSHVYLKELSPFVPALGNFTDVVELTAEASGYIDDIHLRQLTLDYGDKISFAGGMSLKGVTRPEEAYMLGEVSKMVITVEGLNELVNNFSPQPVTLPEPVRRLGVINFTGEISGFFDNLVAYGKLTSAVGSLETDLLFGSNRKQNTAAYLKGNVSSSELLISDLFDIDNPFGIARFNLSIDAKRPVGGYFAGNVKAQVNEFDYKNYRYENLLLSGQFQRNAFDGVLRLDDPNGALYAEGMFRNDKQNSVFNFTADLQHFRPDNLNLTDRLESPEISGSLRADFTGDNPDNIEGSVSIDNLQINTAPSRFVLKQFKITASAGAVDKRLTIASDIVNGEINGVYSFSTLLPSVLNTFKEYVPALVNAAAKDNLKTKENNFSLLLTIENTEALSKTLKLPFTLAGQGRITGHYNNRYDKFGLEVTLPRFMLGNTRFESGYLSCGNPAAQIDLTCRASTYDAKGVRNFLDWKAGAKDNRITNRVEWANNKEQRYEAKLAVSALFEEGNDAEKGLRTEIRLDKGSTLIINDSVWNVAEAGVSIQDGKADIRNFSVSHDAQYLRLNGAVSANPADTLLLDLNQMELSYLFDILNIPILQFGGSATGTFHINDIYKNRIINTNLRIRDFSFNQVALGDLNLFSLWDDSRKGIMMSGHIFENDSMQTNVNGYVYPIGPEAGLDLTFNARRINVAFLYPFMDNVVSGLRGRGSGFVHLFGAFNKVDVDGSVFVEGGELGVGFLNTQYTFSDSIRLFPGLLQMKDLTVYDRHGNTGKVNLEMKHSHFRNLEFRADVQTTNMLVYDVTEKQNPSIYGSIFAGGTSRIYGNERLVHFDINMRSGPHTSVFLNFARNAAVADYDFITFAEKNKTAAQDSTQEELLPFPESGAELRMNFTLDVTPDANIELIMGPTADDKIKGYGTGSLQIEYGTKSDLRMYGAFNILKGNYNFSLQQLIHKDFTIREGSSVSFQGNPNDANLNISAVYNVTANIGDIDQGLIEESVRTNIPVNCVLQLNGRMQNPTISFDLELPGANEEIERKVKSYIDTEDMMTRQIIYLLVLNKFYTADYLQKGANSEFSAVTSAAISSQLSSILNSITDKVQIGTNIRANRDGWDETEVEMLLSTQLLDNRLLFNGNFGYKNNPNVKNIFVGEFDVEWLLNRSGELRLKAYNHANDMYRYLKQSLTTQGIGIMYKKDFSTLSELFSRRRKQTGE